MKARPILILLLFAASVLVLVWLYHASAGSSRKRAASPWQETIADLDECSRDKHARSAQYTHFADIAERENDRQSARLFRAMALSEGIQEQNCVKALSRLGGTYVPPSKVVVFRNSTGENLARSIDLEQHRFTERLCPQIDRAVSAGNRYAAKMLIWSAAIGRQHVRLMQARNPAVCAAGPLDYAVCPVCGNIYDTEFCDHYCPHCLTGCKDFVWFR